MASLSKFKPLLGSYRFCSRHGPIWAPAEARRFGWTRQRPTIAIERGLRLSKLSVRAVDETSSRKLAKPPGQHQQYPTTQNSTRRNEKNEPDYFRRLRSNESLGTKNLKQCKQVPPKPFMDITSRRRGLPPMLAASDDECPQTDERDSANSSSNKSIYFRQSSNE